MFGCSDLHTHIRWRAIREVVEAGGTVVDIGCGDGELTLEYALAFPDANVTGIDLNVDAIRRAEKSRADLGLDNVRFEMGDVRTARLSGADSVLMLDILEHVYDDDKLLGSVASAIRPGGRLVVSTPTPNYPRFFGREFHEAVGHVRDGYWPTQLEAMLSSAGFHVGSTAYYTKLPSSLMCALFYRALWRGKLGVILSPVLSAASHLDTLWPSSRWASSILVVATRGLEAAEPGTSPSDEGRAN